MLDHIFDGFALGAAIEQAPDEIGTPLEDAMCAPGPQERVDSCAIRSQQHVLSMFGIEVTETDLVHDAAAHNEYIENGNYGTMMPDIGNLLERNGVEIQRYEEATMAHLISELGQGHKIIVAVDTYELNAQTEDERAYESIRDQIAQTPNHAVVVVNVDPNTLDVDIVDPADGQMHRIEGSKFMDAWEDSDRFMVSTAKSPEEFQEAFNGNGEVNQWSIDANHDGIADVTISVTPGAAPAALVNMTGDTWTGSDVMNGNVPIDLNGDGVTDVMGTYVDLDGDGMADAIGVDLNHDGVIDQMFGLEDIS